MMLVDFNAKYSVFVFASCFHGNKLLHVNIIRYHVDSHYIYHLNKTNCIIRHHVNISYICYMNNTNCIICNCVICNCTISE